MDPGVSRYWQTKCQLARPIGWYGGLFFGDRNRASCWSCPRPGRWGRLRPGRAIGILAVDIHHLDPAAGGPVWRLAGSGAFQAKKRRTNEFALEERHARKSGTNLSKLRPRGNRPFTWVFAFGPKSAKSGGQEVRRELASGERFVAVSAPGQPIGLPRTPQETCHSARRSVRRRARLVWGWRMGWDSNPRWA